MKEDLGHVTKFRLRIIKTNCLLNSNSYAVTGYDIDHE